MPKLQQTAATRAHLARRFLSPSPNKLVKPLTQQILYHGSSFLVLAKDAESSVQALVGSKQRQNWERMLNDAKKRLELKDDPTPLSRLDKSVTGAVLLSTSKAKLRHLSRNSDDSQEVIKNYLAVVIGKPDFEGLEKMGRRGVERLTPRQDHEQNDTSVSSSKAAKKKRVDFNEDDIEWQLTNSIDSDGERSILTRRGKVSKSVVRLLATSDSFSLLHFRLLTGRKHQLRVQATEALGTPILGDFKYSPSSPRRSKERNFYQVQQGFQSYYKLPENRIFLHCYNVSFPIWEKTFRPIKQKQPDVIKSSIVAEEIVAKDIVVDEVTKQDDSTKDSEAEIKDATQREKTVEFSNSFQPTESEKLKQSVQKKRIEVFLDLPAEFKSFCEHVKLDLPRIDSGWHAID